MSEDVVSSQHLAHRLHKAAKAKGQVELDPATQQRLAKAVDPNIGMDENVAAVEGMANGNMKPLIALLGSTAPIHDDTRFMIKAMLDPSFQTAFELLCKETPKGRRPKFENCDWFLIGERIQHDIDVDIVRARKEKRSRKPKYQIVQDAKDREGISESWAYKSHRRYLDLMKEFSEDDERAAIIFAGD